MNEKDSNLLAITPPKDIAEKVDEYREKYKKLNSSIEPHITIYPPFYIRDLKDIPKMLSEELGKIESKEIIIDSLNYFENGNDQNVAYFKPDKKSAKYLTEIFTACSTALNSGTEKRYADYPTEFNPHMTISASIPDALLPELKMELSAVTESFKFIIKSVDVYEQKENSGIWTKIMEIKLKD